MLAVKKVIDLAKLSYEDLRLMILSLDDSVLGFDGFSNLKSIAPTKEEIEKVKQFKGEPSELDLPSRWIYEMMSIPSFEARIDFFIFKKDYETDYPGRVLWAVNKERVETIECFIKYFMEDDRWHAFLRICLDVGNILNFHDKRRGKAQGFKFATLRYFGNCKSSDGKQYLLPYLMEKIADQHLEGLDFYPEMKTCIGDAVNIHLEDVIQNIAGLKSKFTKLKSLIEFSQKSNPKDENFIANFDTFYVENVKDTISLEAKAIDLKAKLIDMAIKYGDDPRKTKETKTNEIIKEYQKVFAEVGKSVEIILKAKEKEKKKAEKNAKKEKKQRVDDD